MKKCEQCKRKEGLLTTCKYCKYSFCFNCIQQEIHHCLNIEDMKKDKLLQLKLTLEREKCVKSKIIQI
jgi:predicted nucleic acid binding AN1-type Zn finger protein